MTRTRTSRAPGGRTRAAALGAALLTNPQHEYTRLLLDSVPVPV